MNTKEKILYESLKLFSTKGYEATGVEEIAKAVGIKAASLYKHYRNKRAIFDAILIETASRFDAFFKEISIYDELSEKDLIILNPDILIKKVRELVHYSLNDEYVCNFRKLMTVEQFRSNDFSKIYNHRFVDLMFEYYEKLYTRLIGLGLLTDEDPKILSQMYGSTIYIHIGNCDRGMESEEECMEVLEKHVRVFYKQFSKGVCKND